MNIFVIYFAILCSFAMAHSPIMKEWTAHTSKEMDFWAEAENLTRIHEAMRRSGLNVIIPELIPEFTRQKASLQAKIGRLDKRTKSNGVIHLLSIEDL